MGLHPFVADYVFYLVWIEVKGSSLTTGARALAKHVDRSSEGYWGPLHGSGQFPDCGSFKLRFFLSMQLKNIDNQLRSRLVQILQGEW